MPFGAKRGFRPKGRFYAPKERPQKGIVGQRRWRLPVYALCPWACARPFAGGAQRPAASCSQIPVLGL
eukprot:15475458-Alexandrium_andersonii.AAC.1